MSPEDELALRLSKVGDTLGQWFDAAGDARAAGRDVDPAVWREIRDAALEIARIAAELLGDDEGAN